MSKRKAKQITKHFTSLAQANPTQFRNAINQTAHSFQIPERKVHAALFQTRSEIHTQ